MQETEKLKRVYRCVDISDLNRKESSAEHSWHLGIFLMLLNKDVPKELDLHKTLKMLLIHDLVEIYAGDTKLIETLTVYSGESIVYDINKVNIKKEKEKKAANLLFGMLPDDLKQEFMELWEEFEERTTVEAKICKALDKIHNILQNTVSNGTDFKEYKSTFEAEKKLIEPYVVEFPVLQNIVDLLLEEAKGNNLFYS